MARKPTRKTGPDTPPYHIHDDTCVIGHEQFSDGMVYYHGKEDWAFADWIPEVLREIFDLRLLPDPPSRLAIQYARWWVVNEPAGNKRPTVKAQEGDGEIFVYLDFTDGRSLNVFTKSTVEHLKEGVFTWFNHPPRY